MTLKSALLFGTVLGVALAACLFATLALSASDKPPLELLELVSVRTEDLSQNAQNVVLRIKEEKTTGAVSFVRINLDRFKRDTVILNLAPDKNYVAKREGIETRGEKDYTWIADISDPLGNAVLVVTNDSVVGNIRAGDSLYSLRPLEGGIHMLVTVDQSKFPPEHEPEPEEITSTKGQQESRSGSTVTAEAAGVSAPIEITVLVAYTPAAEKAVSPTTVKAFVQQAVDTANKTYRDSEVNIRLKLVHAAKVDYKESGSFDTDLKRFRETKDGYMDEVHSLRDKYGADVGVLIINDDKSCGKAALNAKPETAFAVVHWDCASSNFSFAHELAHLHGGRHNPEEDNHDAPYAYGHGYCYADKWRTVMAYRSDKTPCKCIRIGHWSNPRVKREGVPMGTTDKHDNARVLNETAKRISDFRGGSVR